jgi:hypothetical protein
MKKWMRITVLTVAVLNLMMLTAALSPLPLVSTGQSAFAGNDPPTNPQSVNGGGSDMLPQSCDRCRHCHGFFSCLKWCARCAAEVILDLLD